MVRAMSRPIARSKDHTAALTASLVVGVLGMVVVYMLASAFADGELRRREAPLRALLGNAAFEALSAGQAHPQHYLQRPPTPAWIAALRDAPAHDPERDRRAPDFELPMRDGSTWRMADQRGKVVVLNFWTVTCQPCVEEMPSLIELERLLRGRSDVELVTISTDRDWETVRTVVPDGALTVLLDPDRRVVREMFGTRLYPETWIIDGQGIIRLRVDGRRDWSSPIVLDAIESFR
jgi:peroxiredoxin